MGVDIPMHTLKLDTLLHKIHIKVQRLDIFTFMISLNSISNEKLPPIQPKKPDKTTSNEDGGYRRQGRETGGEVLDKI